MNETSREMTVEEMLERYDGGYQRLGTLEHQLLLEVVRLKEQVAELIPRRDDNGYFWPGDAA